MTAIAILTAVSERLAGTSTQVFRYVPANTIERGIFDGMPEEEVARRSLVRPKFEVTFASANAGEDLYETNPTHIRRRRITVQTAYTFQALSAFDDDTRRTLYALAMTNAELVRAALMAPGTMLRTNGSVATGIVSGCMSSEVSSTETGIDAAAATYRWEQEFECSIVETLAVFPGEPNQYSGLIGWWKAGYGTTAVDGTARRITDRSDGDNTFTLGSASTQVPVVTSAQPYYFNFTNSVVGQFMFNGAALMSAPFTVITALRFNLVNQVVRAGAWNLGTVNTALNATNLSREAAGANGDKLTSYDGTTTVYGPVITGQAPHVVTMTYQASAPYVSARVDGAAVTLTDIAGAIVSNGFFNMGYAFFGNAPMDGRIYEMVVYNRALSATDALAVERYMGTPLGMSF